jgi:hypothetical protein
MLARAPDVAAQPRHHRNHYRGAAPSAPAPVPVVAPTIDPEEAAYLPAINAANAGQSETALTLFRELYIQTHAPRALVRIGSTEAQLGQWIAAEEHLSTALGFNEDAWVVQRRPQLEASLVRAAQHLADLTVVCETPGASLVVNDQPPTALPLERPLRVVRGNLRITVSASDYAAHSETVMVDGMAARVAVTLARPMPAAAVTVAAAAPLPAPRSTSLRRPWGALRITSFALSGVGLVLGVVGLATQTEQDFVSQGCNSETGECTVSYLTSGDSNVELIATGFTLAGLSLGAALAIHFAAPRETPARQAFLCSPGPTTLGLFCAGTF